MRLGTHGVSFTQDGQLATYAGFSEFRLLDRFLRGEDVTALFADRMACLDGIPAPDRAHLIPVLRVFGMMENICQLHPQDYGNFYTSVRALSDFAGGHGFVIDWEIFADAQAIMPADQDQRRHWNTVSLVLQGCQSALLSLGNESQKNGYKPENFSRLDLDLLCSRGSSVSDTPPYTPVWDYSKFHGRRDARHDSNEAGVKARISSCDLAFMVAGNTDTGDQADRFPGTHSPTIHDEPIGAADASVRGRRSAEPAVFYGIAFDSGTYGAGGTFHSDCGVQSILFTDRQRACAQAFFMGLSKTDPVQRYQG